MKYLSAAGFLILAIFIMTGCSKGSAADKAADQLCECANPMVELQKEMADAGEDLEKMEQLMNKAQTTAENMDNCMKTIDDEYKDKDDDSDFQDAVMEALKTKCPEVHKVMNGAL